VVQNGNIVPRLEPEFLESIEKSIETASAAAAELQGSGEVSTVSSPSVSKDEEDSVTDANRVDKSTWVPTWLALMALVVVSMGLLLTLRKSKG